MPRNWTAFDSAPAYAAVLTSKHAPVIFPGLPVFQGADDVEISLSISPDAIGRKLQSVLQDLDRGDVLPALALIIASANHPVGHGLSLDFPPLQSQDIE